MVTRNQITGQTNIIVKIDQVDLDHRIAHAFDKTGAPIQVSWRQSAGGVTRIPNQGEKWTAQKVGFTWYLEDKLDSLDEHSYVQSSMQPGDTRLSADGTIHIKADAAHINGRGIAPVVHDTFNETSSFTSIVLASEVSTPESIMIFVNGLLVSPVHWLIDNDNRTITFATAQAAGEVVVYYQTWAEALDDF